MKILVKRTEQEYRRLDAAPIGATIRFKNYNPHRTYMKISELDCVCLDDGVVDKRFSGHSLITLYKAELTIERVS